MSGGIAVKYYPLFFMEEFSVQPRPWCLLKVNILFLITLIILNNPDNCAHSSLIFGSTGISSMNLFLHGIHMYMLTVGMSAVGDDCGHSSHSPGLQTPLGRSALAHSSFVDFYKLLEFLFSSFSDPCDRCAGVLFPRGLSHQYVSPSTTHPYIPLSNKLADHVTYRLYLFDCD